MYIKVGYEGYTLCNPDDVQRIFRGLKCMIKEEE